MSDDGVHVTARVRDPELVEALESASDEAGSRSEAIRLALRETYVGETEREPEQNNELPVKARDGHRKLVEWTGVGGRIELDTAESILANHLNVQKEAIRKVVIYPLKQAEAIRIHQGIHSVSVVVGTLDGDLHGDTRAAATSSRDAVADGGETRERLDELAAAGMGVNNGDE